MGTLNEGRRLNSGNTGGLVAALAGVNDRSTKAGGKTQATPLISRICAQRHGSGLESALLQSDEAQVCTMRQLLYRNHVFKIADESPKVRKYSNHPGFAQFAGHSETRDTHQILRVSQDDY